MNTSSFSEIATLNATELKIHLKEAQEGNRIWDDESTILLVRSMLEHIGSTDSELRDHLIYNTYHTTV